MRKVKEVLRLKFERGLANRQIARSCSLPHSTVANYLARAQAAGLRWPLAEELDEAAVENRLFRASSKPPSQGYPPPDFPYIHEELTRHKHVTLQLLWQEYKQAHPQGYQYSRFCKLYCRWRQKLDLVLRQEHRAGEKLFVDYAGQKVPVVNPQTGVLSEASIFVAVLGASNYTFAEASWKEDLPSWITSHVRALKYLGGAPAIVVPDNPRVGVSRACRYEPDLNPTYQDFAAHYHIAVIPARPRKPRDKAKVEAAVLVVERWILAALRKRTFLSLAELNQAIAELLEVLNHRPFRKLPGSRADLFETLDRPALQPLPAEPYHFAEWKKARVNIDYHVEVDRHYYSVPYPLVQQRVEARFTATTVEIFHRGRRVASHIRSYQIGRHTSNPAHRPKSHQCHLDWTPSRLIRWGRTVGPSTAALVEKILKSRPHPEQGYRSCLGILRLAKGYGPERLEQAAARALKFQTYSYRSLKSILKTGLDRQAWPEPPPSRPPLEHANIRGTDYFDPQQEGASC